MRGKELRIISKPRMGFNISLNLIAVSEAIQKNQFSNLLCRRANYIDPRFADRLWLNCTVK